MSLVVLRSWADGPPKIRGIHTDTNDDLVYVPDHMGQFVAQELSNKPQKVKRSVIIPGRKKMGELSNNSNKSKSDTAINMSSNNNTSKNDSKNVIVKGGEQSDESQNQNHHHHNADNDNDSNDGDEDDENNGSSNNNKTVVVPAAAAAAAIGTTDNNKSFKSGDKYASNPTINSTNTNNQHILKPGWQQQQQQLNRRINEGRKPAVKPKPLLLRSVSTSPEQDLSVDLDSTPPSSPVSGRYRNLGPDLAACIPKRQLKFGINWMRDGSSSFNEVSAYRRSLNNSTPSLSTLQQDFYSSEGEDKISSCFSSSQCSSTTPSPQPPSTLSSCSLSNISKSQQQQHQQQGTEVRTKERQQQQVGSTRPISISSTASLSSSSSSSPLLLEKGKTAPVPALQLQPTNLEHSSSSKLLSKEKVTESRLSHESASSPPPPLSSSTGSNRINRRPPRQRQQLSSPSTPPPPPPDQHDYYRGLSPSTQEEKVSADVDFSVSKNGNHRIVDVEPHLIKKQPPSTQKESPTSEDDNDSESGKVVHKSDVILVEVIRKKLTGSSSASSVSPSGSESVSSCGSSDLESEYLDKKSKKRRPHLILPKSVLPPPKRNLCSSDPIIISSVRPPSVSSVGRKSVDFSDHLEYIGDKNSSSNGYSKKNNSHKKNNNSSSCESSRGSSKENYLDKFENFNKNDVKNIIYTSSTSSHPPPQVNANDTIFTTVCASPQSDLKTTTVTTTTTTTKASTQQVEQKQKEEKGESTSSSFSNLFINKNQEEEKIKDPITPSSSSSSSSSNLRDVTFANLKGTKDDDSCSPRGDNITTPLEQEQQHHQQQQQQATTRDDDKVELNKSKSSRSSSSEGDAKAVSAPTDNVDQDNFGQIVVVATTTVGVEGQQQQQKKNYREKKEPPVDTQQIASGNSTQSIQTLHVLPLLRLEESPSPPSPHSALDSFTGHGAASTTTTTHNESRIDIIIDKKTKESKEEQSCHPRRPSESTADYYTSWKKCEQEEEEDQCDGVVVVVADSDEAARQCQKSTSITVTTKCQDDEEILEQDGEKSESSEKSEKVVLVDSSPVTKTTTTVKEEKEGVQQQEDRGGKGKLDSQQVSSSSNKVSSVLLLTQVEQAETKIQKSQYDHHHDNNDNHQREESHAQQPNNQTQSSGASVSANCDDDQDGEEEENNHNNSHSILLIQSSTPLLDGSMDRGKTHHLHQDSIGPSPIASVKIPVQAVNKHVHRSDSSDECEPDVIWRNSAVRESFRGFCQELLESSSNGSQSEPEGNEKIIIHVPQPQKSQQHQKQQQPPPPQNNFVPSSHHHHQGMNDGVIEFEDDEEIYDESAEEDDRCSTELSSSDRPETPIHNQQTNNSIEYISVLDNVQVTGGQTTVTNKGISTPTTTGVRGDLTNNNHDHYNVYPKPCKWIISLDLGSRTSGFSYWSHCDPDVVHIGSWSGDGCTHKIPSWILTTMDNMNKKKGTDQININKSPTVKPFYRCGQDALDEYTENRGGGRMSSFVSQWREYFQLDDSNEAARLLTFPYTLESMDEDMDFDQLVTALIHYFGRAALSQMQTKFATLFDKGEKIEWLVTVPSCWSSSSRQCIREAAYKSGVVKADDGVNLIEDSISACIFAAMCGPHDNFLALDVGGAFLHYGGFQLKYGAMHQTLQGKSCPLPTPEATFEHLLTQIVSREFILYYKAKYRPGWIELTKNFEKAKCKFDNSGANSQSSGFVFLPSSFVVEFNSYTGMEVSECLQEQNSGITWNENGALSIPPHEMKLILKPTLDFVLNKIESIFLKHEFEHLVLTGGFANCKFLKESIGAKFPELSLIMPKEFANGVLQGSTLSLMPNIQPKLVIKSPFSIGVGVMTPFDPVLHPEEKKIVKDGKTWCADAWDTLIKYGQEMELNSVINKRSYVGAQPGQSCLVLPLFKSSQSQVPQLVTECAVTKCCELRFESTKTWQEIDLILSCRASELIIMAVDPLSTNIVHRVVIDLL